ADRANRRFIEGVQFPDDSIEAIGERPNVAATSSVLKGTVTVQSALRTEPAQIYGIVLNDHMTVSDLEEQVLFGSIDNFRETPTGLMIGRKLADRLQARVGDSLIVLVNGAQRRYRVSAVYETGVSDIDRVRMFMHLDQ